MNKTIISLNGKWNLYGYEHGTRNISFPKQLESIDCLRLSATVPGNVELDLSEAGLLPADLFLGENLRLAQPYEKYDWWYQHSFSMAEIPAGKKVRLRFGGVDCYAEYFLNNKKIGESDNMLIEHTFDITNAVLQNQENTLSVHIISTVAVLSDMEIDPCIAQRSWNVNKGISASCRKAPHCFGWDIMPRALSAGLWRNVELTIEEECGFSYLYTYITDLSHKGACVHFLFDCHVPQQNAFDRMHIEITATCKEHSFVISRDVPCKSGKIEGYVDGLKLWWPRYYGEANMYNICVKAFDMNGKFLFESEVRRGFRSISLNRTDVVENGKGEFRFVINNTPIFVYGSNWVPLDVFHSRDKDRLQKALDLAWESGSNILRCWGGNVYEDTPFFDYCDEHGILVWQDFAMACQFYPATDEFMARMQAEAESVVKKLRQHPCLALWCGDNENDYMVASFGVNPKCNEITRQVLSKAIDRLDPCTPYIPSSPYVSERAFELGEKSYPENHLWGPRVYYKSDYYFDSNACFVSEIGYHGCPSADSVKKFIEPQYIWPYENNRQWNYHSTDEDNNDSRVLLMKTQIQSMFGSVPEDLETFVKASQYSQAEAYRFFIERSRADMQKMGGVIWWNLLDGWPQMSDAVVDYYFEKKKAFSSVVRSSNPLLLLFSEPNENGESRLLCANNTLKDISGVVKVIDAATKETVFRGDFCAKSNSNTTVTTIVPNGQVLYYIIWEAENYSGKNTHLFGKAPFNFNQYQAWLNDFETE